MKLEFVQHFAADVLVEVRKLNLGQDLKLGLVKILNFMLSGDADVWLRLLDDA